MEKTFFQTLKPLHVKEDIESLINRAIINENISDKKLAFIYKKAEELGIDQTEINQLIELKLSQIKQKKQAPFSLTKKISLNKIEDRIDELFHPIEVLIYKNKFTKTAKNDQDDSNDEFASLQFALRAALTSSFIGFISFFMPWLKVTYISSQDNSSMYLTNYHEFYSGWMVYGAIIGMVFSIIGICLSYKKFKYSIFIGIINLLISVSYLFGWLGKGITGGLNLSTDNTIISTEIHPGYGLYLFILAAIIYVISTSKFLKKE
jgi:hypothetical protein